MRWISVVDLLSHEKAKKILMHGSNEDIKEMLYGLGFDVYGYGLEYQIVVHVPLSWKSYKNKSVYTGRFVSQERSDEEWIESGNCSEEKRLSKMYLEDKELVKEIERLSYLPNWTGMAMAHLEEHWTLKKEGKKNNG